MAKKTEYEQYPLCSTRIGWFTDRCCCTAKNRELEECLGVGITTYFKQLKTLSLLLLSFTVLSLPAYILCYSAGLIRSDSTDAESKSMSMTDALFSISLN